MMLRRRDLLLLILFGWNVLAAPLPHQRHLRLLSRRPRRRLGRLFHFLFAVGLNNLHARTRKGTSGEEVRLETISMVV